jgi:hypothetical protein
MHDNAFATKRFTRQQGVKQTKQALYQFSDFWKQKLTAMQQKELEKRSIIFRSLNELEDRSLECIPLVHNFKTDHTFCRIAFALSKLRTRHRIKGSAMRAEEGAAFQDWSNVRHICFPTEQGRRSAANLLTRVGGQ